MSRWVIPIIKLILFVTGITCLVTGYNAAAVILLLLMLPIYKGEKGEEV